MRQPRHFVRIYLLVLACNVVGVVDGLAYAYLQVWPAMTGPERRLFVLWALASYGLSMAAAAGVEFWLLRPVIRALSEGTAGDLARRRALNLPSSITRLCLVSWMVAAGFLPVLLASSGAFLVLRLAIASIFVGVVTSAFAYYVVETYARRFLLPGLLVGVDPSRVPGARPVPLWFKILNLLVVSCCIPVIVLAFESSIEGTSTLAIILLAVAFLGVGVFMMVCILRSIFVPIRDLAREMEKVAAGELPGRLEVVTNDQLGRLAEGFNEMVDGLRQGEFVKETFGRYVTRQVLDEILKGRLDLGGELRTATVLFSDIRGFTALSERSSPSEVVSFLNEYLDIMVDVLVRWGGTIDKFMGDAIMASFGIPLSREDDARRAVCAGLAMIERLEEWNRERVGQGRAPVEIGIGLATGPVIAGNIGSSKKMEYTVIGDTVNTSCRIEQLNKDLGTRLLVSDETYALVAGDVEARTLDPIAVKGKSEPIQVHEVIGWCGGRQDPLADTRSDCA